MSVVSKHDFIPSAPQVLIPTVVPLPLPLPAIMILVIAEYMAHTRFDTADHSASSRLGFRALRRSLVCLGRPWIVRDFDASAPSKIC